MRQVARALLGAVAVAGALLWAPGALALSAAELQSLLAGQPRPMVIDVRKRASYARGHIPGAINIPASVLGRKRLPPLGTVVLYGDGMDVRATREARDALAAAGGVDALVLDGGFPAWEAHTRLSTRGRGLFDEHIRQITYRELMTLQAEHPDLVLLDLRRPGRSAALNSRFPGREVLTRERGAAGGRGDARGGRLPLDGLSPDAFYVLIDDGSGRLAEAVARRLRTRGIKGVAILSGGQKALETRGEERSITLSNGQ